MCTYMKSKKLTFHLLCKVSTVSLTGLCSEGGSVASTASLAASKSRIMESFKLLKKT